MPSTFICQDLVAGQKDKSDIYSHNKDRKKLGPVYQEALEVNSILDSQRAGTLAAEDALDDPHKLADAGSKDASEALGGRVVTLSVVKLDEAALDGSFLQLESLDVNGGQGLLVVGVGS